MISSPRAADRSLRAVEAVYALLLPCFGLAREARSARLGHSWRAHPYGTGGYKFPKVFPPTIAHARHAGPHGCRYDSSTQEGQNDQEKSSGG